MKTMLMLLLIAVPAAALGYLTAKTYRAVKNGASPKKLMGRNLLAFGVVLVLACAMAFSVSAATTSGVPQDEAAPAAETAQTAQTDNSKGMGLLAAAIVTSISGIGGGIAVAAGAPAAIAAASENAESFGKSLIFVALGESIALYGVVIAILILNKV